jgi:MarR family 2-MHQ and catechol resistance regulon transcriptional repressor
MKEDLSGVHVWLVLWKAWTAVRAWDEQSIASLDMSLTDFAVLEVLLHKGPQPVNEIGRVVQLTSGSITTAVTRLQRRKLLERGSSTEDARVVLVHLTPKGRRLIEQLFDLHARNLEMAVDVLNLEERRQLLPLLRKLGLHAAALAGRGIGATPLRTRVRSSSR